MLALCSSSPLLHPRHVCICKDLTISTMGTLQDGIIKSLPDSSNRLEAAAFHFDTVSHLNIIFPLPPSTLLSAIYLYSILHLVPSTSPSFHHPSSWQETAQAQISPSPSQILLFARSSTLIFHGTEVLLLLPAGIAILSAGLDVTLGFPSWQSNALFDIFSDTWCFLAPGYPTCKIWPSDPPHGHAYCGISTMLHPLVAPALARNWEGALPMWFADRAKSAAERAARQGVHCMV